MTSLWRHICLAKVGASLQHAISREEPRISFFASTRYLLVRRRGRIVYCGGIKDDLTLNNFLFINQIKFDHHWREIMLHQLNVIGDSCKSTLVLKRKADILSTSYDISIHQWLSNIQCWRMLNSWLLLSVVELCCEIRLCSGDMKENVSGCFFLNTV